MRKEDKQLEGLHAWDRAWERRMVEKTIMKHMYMNFIVKAIVLCNNLKYYKNYNKKEKNVWLPVLSSVIEYWVGMC